jgi:hypothetical protein
MYTVLIKGKPTTCQSGRGGATKDDIIAELNRRGLEYKKSTSKGELCRILSKDDERKEGKEGKRGKRKRRRKSDYLFPRILLYVNNFLANIRYIV